MKNFFEPESLSIWQLFNKDVLYQIPNYQRPYKWGMEQLEQLWADIYEAYEEDAEGYFLGSVITANPTNKDSGYLDIVDGQQRMTTLMILFCVIRDNFEDINRTSENPFAVDLNRIKQSIVLNNRANRLKLHTHAQHQIEFINNVLEEGATKEIPNFYKYQLKNDHEPKYKFLNTAKFFKDKLESISSEIRDELINYLFNKVYVIRIDCSNREFAIKLFQVLNNRGMDLTAADLIKSFLIENIRTYKKSSIGYKNSELDEDIKKDEASFIAEWQKIEGSIKDSININELLVMYQYYLLGVNPRKSLTDELQELFKGKDPLTVIGDIKRFASIYREKILESDSTLIYSLSYLRWTMYWQTIVTTAYFENYAEVDELIFELRRFYYLYWIAGKTLTQIKTISFTIINAIKQHESIDRIKERMESKIKGDNILSLAKDSLVSSIIDDEAWIKPLLLSIEYNMNDDSLIKCIILDNKLHLEHILPRGYKPEEWRDISENIARTWIHSAGNLTLLSGKKNIDASNHAFDKKIDSYTNGKVTAFRVTQNIVDDYRSNKYRKEWNEETMQARWNWFFSELEKILRIDCKDIKESKPRMN